MKHYYRKAMAVTKRVNLACEPVVRKLQIDQILPIKRISKNVRATKNSSKRGEEEKKSVDGMTPQSCWHIDTTGKELLEKKKVRTCETNHSPLPSIPNPNISLHVVEKYYPEMTWDRLTYTLKNDRIIRALDHFRERDSPYLEILTGAPSSITSTQLLFVVL